MSDTTTTKPTTAEVIASKVKESKQSMGWYLRSLRSDLMKGLGQAAYTGDAEAVALYRAEIASCDKLAEILLPHGINAAE